MKKTLLPALLLCCLVSACRKDEMRQCVAPGFAWMLSGYDTSQVGVFVVNTYEKGSNFAQQLSHTVSGTWFHPDSTYGPDTTAYQVSFEAHPFPETFGGRLDRGYDYEFSFPLAGRTFRLRDISIKTSTEPYDRESGVVKQCAFQYYLNDTLYERPVREVSNKAGTATYIYFHL